MRTTPIITLDSLEYPKSAIIEGDKIFITGYTSTGVYSSYSIITCVNIKNHKKEWSRVINTHPTVQLLNIGIIDGRLYVTGFGGVVGLMKDSNNKKISDPIDLNPIIISVSLDGKDYNYKEIEGDNPHFIGSRIVKHQGKLYMTYSHLDGKDWDKIVNSCTKIVEITRELEIVRSKNFYSGTINYQRLIIESKNLLMVGTYGSPSQLIGFEFDKESLDTKSFPLATEKNEYNYACFTIKNGFRVISIGYQNSYRKDWDKASIISEYEFKQHKWTKRSQCLFKDNVANVNNQTFGVHNKKALAFVQDSNHHYSLSEVDGKGIKQQFRFSLDNYDNSYLYLYDLIFDENKIPYFILVKNERAIVYKMNQEID